MLIDDHINNRHHSFPVADMEWLVPVEPPDPDHYKGTM